VLTPAYEVTVGTSTREGQWHEVEIVERRDGWARVRYKHAWGETSSAPLLALIARNKLPCKLFAYDKPDSRYAPPQAARWRSGSRPGRWRTCASMRGARARTCAGRQARSCGQCRQPR
jgi:hypothetical protein